MLKLSCLALASVLAVAVVVNTGCMKCGENMAKKVSEEALEAAVEKASGGKADIDVSGNIDISGVPEFARYPGAKATTKWSLSADEGTGTVYALETADEKGKVTEWYRASLAASNWKQAAVLETGDGTSFTYASGDEKQVVNVVIAAEKGGSTITVMVSTKP